MPKRMSPRELAWELADDACNRLDQELKSAAKTVFEAAVGNSLEVGEAAALMSCLAKAEKGIHEAKNGISEWLGSSKQGDEKPSSESGHDGTE